MVALATTWLCPPKPNRPDEQRIIPARHYSVITALVSETWAM